MKPLFAQAGIDVVTLDAAGIAESKEEEDAIEVFSTFEENAVAKARYFHDKSGLATFADDSGLEVFALGGAPGVHSKRWSGRTDLLGQTLDDANNAELLRVLGPSADRRARYVCAAALVTGEGVIVRRGVVDGRVVEQGRGSNGFGYDPFFLSSELGVTFGEASLEEKERVSHRARAFRELLAALGTRVRR